MLTTTLGSASDRQPNGHIEELTTALHSLRLGYPEVMKTCQIAQIILLTRYVTQSCTESQKMPLLPDRQKN